MSRWSTTSRGFQQRDRSRAWEDGAGTVQSWPGGGNTKGGTGGKGSKAERKPPHRPEKCEGRASTAASRGTGAGAAVQAASRGAIATAAAGKPPTGQNLKQAAAKARAEKLRSALQQLRATRSAGGRETVPANAAADGRTPAPQMPQHTLPTELENQAAASSSPGDLGNEIDVLFDDASLSFMARLKLGNSQRVQPSKQAPALIGALGSADPPWLPSSCSAARQALRVAAADEAMSPEFLQLGTTAGSPGRHQVKLDSVGNSLQAETAPLQQRLERMQTSLNKPHHQQQMASPATGRSPQPDSNSLAEPGAQVWPAASPATQPQRQRVAAEDLVVTRAPRPPQSSASCLSGDLPSNGSRLGSSTAAAVCASAQGTAVTRLAALLAPQSQEPPLGLEGGRFAPVMHQHGSAPPASNIMGELPSQLTANGSRPPCTALIASPDRAYTAHPVKAFNAFTWQSSGPSSLSLVSNPAGSTGALAPGPAPGSGDILEAWRSRRRGEQRGQLALAEKYGKYLLLQQQRQHAPLAVPTAGASGAAPSSSSRAVPAQPEAAPRALTALSTGAEWRARQALPATGAGDSRVVLLTPVPPAPEACQSPLRRGSWQPPAQPAVVLPPSQAADAKESSSSSSSRSPQAPAASHCSAVSSSLLQGGGGGDILERWRARRRQQGQQSAAANSQDYSTLLTLRMPVTPPSPAAASLVPAAAGAGQASHSSGLLQPVAPPPVSFEPSWGRQQAASANVAAASGHHRAAASSAQSACPQATIPGSRWGELGAMTAATLASSVSLACRAPAAVNSAAAAEPASRAAQPPTAAAQPPTVAEFGSSAAPHSAEQLPQGVPAKPSKDKEQPLDEPFPAAAAGKISSTEAVYAATLQQPSRPASAASAAGSGRATPHSTTTLESRASSCWSPGMSMLLDDVIGNLLFSEGNPALASAHEPAAEPDSGHAPAIHSSTGAAAAIVAEGPGAAGSSSCPESANQQCQQQPGSAPADQPSSAGDVYSASPAGGSLAGGSHREADCQVLVGGQEEQWPDPADLGFLSSTNSPGYSHRQAAAGGATAGAACDPPANEGVVATARALLEEAVQLLEHGAAANHVSSTKAPSPAADGARACAATHVAAPETPDQQLAMGGGALPEQASQ